MKSILFLLLLILLPVLAVSQAPQKIDFQAIARDAEGNVMANENISIQITILKDNASGALAYQEKHEVSTDKYGLFVLNIGDGQLLQKQFSSIDWSTGPHYVKIDIDPAGGNNYINMGTLEMMSVPFALYAENAGNVDDADADPSNELQKLSLSGTNLTLSDGGGTVTLPAAGGGDNWGTQSVVSDPTFEGTGTTSDPLKLSRQGANTNQVLKWGGNTWTPGKDEINDADANSTNELQMLSLSDNELTISDGNTVTLPSGNGFSGSWNELTNVPSGFADNKDDINDADANSTNELQLLSLSSNKLSISDGNTVTLPSGNGFSGSWNDLADVPTGFADNKDDVNDADADPNNEIQTLSIDASGNTISIEGGNDINILGGHISNPESSVIRINQLEVYNGIVSEDDQDVPIRAIAEGNRPFAAIRGDCDGFGYGGVFTTTSTGRTGVLGTGNAAGVRGISYESEGLGVHGETDEFKGRGVKGEATGDNSIGVWGVALEVNSTGVYGQGAKWDFYADGPGTNYGGASSIRWKRNISPIPNALDKVMSMRGVYFNWDEAHGGSHDMGMIAEEVGKVVPEIVQYESNGVDASGMDYGKLTPMLLEAIKVQQKIIEDLQKRVSFLESQNVEIK